ncbi:MAG TPA: DUF1385 domain-containing protein [Clostridia bacterium]|nr:DUF1385 domain-containing protein [Clostridia bacterium]
MAEKKHKTMIGGQAVIEGVMMKGPRSTAMAVRKTDGEISLETWENKDLGDRSPFFRIPLIRGVVNFVQMLRFGYQCLMKSAEIAGIEEEPSNLEQKVEKAFGEKTLKALMSLSSLIGIVLAIVLFVVIPSVFISKTDVFLHYGAYKTLAEGLLKIGIFLLYLFLISKISDIGRVFEYHGAEHKTISCYENGKELTVENARGCTRFHPRCGTSFILIVFIVSILVFSFVTWSSLAVRILLKLLLLPFVVGVSYEIIKFAGRHDNSLMRFLLAPGLWLQRMTTREPDDSQLEVAIQSLEAVLTGNPEDDGW